jgi:hypothetical protein
VYDELALLGKIFIKEINQDLQPSTSNRILREKMGNFSISLWMTKDTTYEMNICKVNTDVWHSNWINFEACSRHSDGYLLEVKPAEEYEITIETTSGHDYAPIITGIPLG